VIILSQPIYSIELSKILLDEFFIVEEHEQLTRNVEKYGLEEPLSVEGPIKGDHYILVDGYKRYKSLIQLGWTNVQCKVESVTDDAHRILKRLRWDYSKKKMKSKERIRYVHWLLNLNWTVNEIAEGTGIALEVIRKYKKIKYVNQQSKDLINSLGLGDKALLSIDRMSNCLPFNIYRIIEEELINYPKIYGYHVDAIECLSRSAKVKQSVKVQNNAELLFDAGNLAAFLLRIKKEYKQDYFNIVNAVKMVAPYLDDFYLEPSGDGESLTLRWRQTGCDDIFNANQFSDGTLRFICLSTLLLQPSKLQPESIVIDEPELGLHPYAITALAEMVKQVSKKKQLILSTQSVELLNEFDVDDIVTVDRGNEGTKFNRHTEDELIEWLDSDYSLGDLWKKNIIGGRFSK